MKRRSFIGTCVGLLFGGKAAATDSLAIYQPLDLTLAEWRIHAGCNRSGATNWSAVEVARAVTLQDVNEAVDPLNYLVLPGERRP